MESEPTSPSDERNKRAPSYSAASVTPSPPRKKPRLVEGWCAERSTEESCYCYKAGLEQQCQSCNRRICKEHCIVKTGAGWVHVRCRCDEHRGIESIERGLNPSVSMLESGDVGNGLNGDSHRLTYEESGGTSSAIVVTQEEAETESNGRWTQEQINILGYEASPGDLICINALAGCGKTTTIALLCNHLQGQGNEILYIVFGKKAQEEACASTKFPRENMTIATSHSFVRKHYFRGNFMACKPTAGYDIEDIRSVLKLDKFVRQRFPNLSLPMQLKRARTIASYIEKTLNKFQSSVDKKVKECHVFWYAKKGVTTRTQWRQSVRSAMYVSWANEMFDTVRGRCKLIRERGVASKIPHDAYMKVAQLEGLKLPYNVIAVDEAQDMTPCQANLFWGTRSRSDKVIYLFGDEWQQLYRFRGASDSFKMAKFSSAENFSLTGSFRFGQEIAKLASLALTYGGGKKVIGRATNPGMIKSASEFSSGVVICRSNNGMYSYLLDNGTRVDQWTFLKPTKQAPQPSRLLITLERFMLDEVESFRHKGETFKTVNELREYCDDGEDHELRKCLTLLDILMKGDIQVSDFYATIQESYVPLEENESVDDFDGVVLTTCHGAKGLEFDNVCIHNDFDFDAILSTADFLNRPRLCDEINAIYVAVTRAKKCAYLSDEALAFFQHINPDPFFSSISLENMRCVWDRLWTCFSSNGETIESKADIPWPSGPSTNNPFCLDRLMSQQEQNDHVRKMILRFHVDKFMAKYQSRMKDTDQEEVSLIIETLNDYLVKAKTMRDVLKSDDSGMG